MPITQEQLQHEARDLTVTELKEYMRLIPTVASKSKTPSTEDLLGLIQQIKANRHKPSPVSQPMPKATKINIDPCPYLGY